MNTAPLPSAPDAALATVPLHLTQLHVAYDQAVRLLRIRDSYDWHQHLWQAFPGRDGEARDFLVRIDEKEETYRVLILSRGYGNCRITNTCRPHTWRVVYYNSQDVVILNTVEISELPEVAQAAIEDLEDSQERLREVLAWVEQA